MRTTSYADEIVSVQDAHGQRIERIFVKDKQRDEIRFSWWPNNKFVTRPLDIPEDELLELMCAAISKGVFTPEFRKGLHEALYDGK